MLFSACGDKVIVHEPEEIPRYKPVDWEALGDGERRCKNCEKLKKDKCYGDFICKHMKGYVEVPGRVRRCKSCDKWKKSEGIPGNFWCVHNKYLRKEWDKPNGEGWFGAEFRVREIRKTRSTIPSSAMQGDINMGGYEVIFKKLS